MLLFVLCVYLILWALRTRSARRALQLSRIVGLLIVVFLLALNRRWSWPEATSCTGCSEMAKVELRDVRKSYGGSR